MCMSDACLNLLRVKMGIKTFKYNKLNKKIFTFVCKMLWVGTQFILPVLQPAPYDQQHRCYLQIMFHHFPAMLASAPRPLEAWRSPKDAVSLSLGVGSLINSYSVQ